MPNNKVIIRVDGNSNIGLGHIYRGIALAEMLQEKFEISFLIQKKSTISPIVDAGFSYAFLPKNISIKDEPVWLNQNIDKETSIVLDGYFFNEAYQTEIKSYNYKLVYIDDLHEGIQKADVVINHSPSATEEQYKKESYTKLALGLDYALLRKEFLIKNTDSNSVIQFDNILISFGGADPKDFSLQALQEMDEINSVKKINVVLGAAYKHQTIWNYNSKKVTIHQDISGTKMYELMQACNLAIVPASTISLELASLHKVMLLGYYVDNQKGIYDGIITKNGAHPLGDFNELIFSSLSEKMEKLKEIKIQPIFKSNSKKNIVNIFHSFRTKIRAVTEDDINFIFELSNQKSVRLSSYHSNIITFETHKVWFKKQLDLPANYFYIIMYDDISVGQIRFFDEQEYAVIGVSINEKHRGLGLAENGLNLAIKKYRVSSKLPIYAYIKRDNLASIKLFEKANFSCLKNEIIKGIDSFVYILNND